MTVIVTNSYDDSCLHAARMIREVVSAQPHAKLGLATGGTPLPIYRQLIAWCKSGELSFANTRTVNLDEYVGLQGNHPQSYRYFMDENLFNHINIDKANTYVATGLGNPEESAAQLEAKVYEGGVPALQLLGIGANGHIGFNEAGTTLTAKSHVEELAASTIEANARFFDTAADVPTKAVTMGMKGILAAESLVLVATGANKKAAISGLLMNDVVTPENPATFLKLHKNATVIIDTHLADLIGYQY